MEEILQKCVLFKGMQTSEIEAVLNTYHHNVRAFNKKEFVIMQNDVCENQMIVVEGQVQAQMLDVHGKLIVIEEFGVSQILAPAFIFSDINRIPVSVFVLKPSKILYFSKSILLQMIRENQVMLLNFLNLISNRSYFLSRKLEFHAFMSIKDKISNYLLEEYNKQKSLHIYLKHTQQELADMFGIARPSLARAFAEMEKVGIIRMKNKEVDIVDLKRLRQ